MQSTYSQRVMKINPYWGFGKTKPIKANNQSSLIANHLEGKPNSNPISNVRRQSSIEFRHKQYSFDIRYFYARYVWNKTYLFPHALPKIIMKLHETFLED